MLDSSFALRRASAFDVTRRRNRNATAERACPALSLASLTPLGQCFDDTACSTFLIGFADPFVEVESNHVDSDSRIQSVVYANGKLWTVLDTAASISTGSGPQVKARIGYFILTPSVALA